MRTAQYVFPARDRPLTEEEVAYSKHFEEYKLNKFHEDPAGNTLQLDMPTKTMAELLAEENGEAKVLADFERRWKTGYVEVITTTPFL